MLPSQPCGRLVFVKVIGMTGLVQLTQVPGQAELEHRSAILTDALLVSAWTSFFLKCAFLVDPERKWLAKGCQQARFTCLQRKMGNYQPRHVNCDEPPVRD